MKRVAILLVFGLSLGLVSLGHAELTQRGNLRLSFDGQITPSRLPRKGSAPVKVAVSVKIAPISASKPPPQLTSIKIQINRYGVISSTGLPVCEVDDIQPSTTENALRACGPAKVGEGSFSADVVIPQQSPFPSEGKVVAFNGVEKGSPVIFAHVYGTDPVPTSYTLPLRITRAKGTFATVLAASLPRVTSDVAFVTGISLTLDRRFRYRGQRRSYLSAGCPAPKGFPGAVFPFARASVGFQGGPTVGTTLTRNCKAEG
jgi:hypothetical protein